MNAISALVHTDPGRAETAAVFAHELFRHREGLTHRQQCELTYQRMRLLNERLPAASALLEKPRTLLTALETAAVVSPSLFLAMTIHYCLSANAVAEFGRGRADLAPYVAELDSMASIGTLVVTEIGHGNSHLAIRTQARLDRETGEFVLHTPDPDARKFMSNNGLPGVPKIGVVYARLLDGDTDHGIFPFVLRLRGPDGTPPGIRIDALPETTDLPLDYAVVEFTHARIPRHSLLHDSAELDADGVLTDPLGPQLRLKRSLTVRENAWLASAAALASVARAAAGLALRHAGVRISRSRFSAERPVLGFRPQQQALFGALAETYALTCLVNRAKQAWIEPGADDPLWTPAAALGRTLGLAKAAATATAGRVTTTCAVRSGAHGMFAVNRLAGYRGLAHMLNPAAGDGRLIELDAGRALAEGEHYTPPSAVRPAGFDPADPAAVRALAAWRERRLHEQLTGELALARRRGQDLFHQWDNRLPLACRLAEAHIRRLELDCFAAAVEAVPDRRARAALEPLLAWHALARVEADLAWYVAEGVVTAEQATALPSRFHRLCEELLSVLPELAGALELPGAVLDSPLAGTGYGEAYRELP